MSQPNQTDAKREAQALIDESIAHDCIARGTYTEALRDELEALCSDSVYAGEVYEFWSDSDSAGDDAMAWRVHLGA